MRLLARRKLLGLCICFAAAICASNAAAQSETDVIVSTCHFANAEWGTDAINRCIEYNKSTRDIVLQLGAAHPRLLERCRKNDELGWDWVKSCIERDVSAQAALDQYPAEKAALIAACQAEFGATSAAKVKACVDHDGKHQDGAPGAAPAPPPPQTQ